jgi:hypothetical protein
VAFIQYTELGWNVVEVKWTLVLEESEQSILCIPDSDTPGPVMVAEVEQTVPGVVGAISKCTVVALPTRVDPSILIDELQMGN